MAHVKKKIVLCLLTLLLAGTLWAQMVVPTINASGGGGTINPATLSGLYCLLTGCTISPGPLVVDGNFEVGVGFVSADNVSQSVGVGAAAHSDPLISAVLGGGATLAAAVAGSDTGLEACPGLPDGTIDYGGAVDHGIGLCVNEFLWNLFEEPNACGIASLGSLVGVWGGLGLEITDQTECAGVMGDCVNNAGVNALELIIPPGLPGPAIGTCSLTVPGAATYHDRCSINGGIQSKPCVSLPSGHGTYFSCPAPSVIGMTEYTLCAAFIPAGETMKNAVVATMTADPAGGAADILSGIVVADFLKNSALAAPPAASHEVRAIASNQQNAGLQTICMAVDILGSTLAVGANGWSFTPGDSQNGGGAPTLADHMQIGGGDAPASVSPDFVGALVALQVWDAALNADTAECYASQMGQFNRGSL